MSQYKVLTDFEDYLNRRIKYISDATMKGLDEKIYQMNCGRVAEIQQAQQELRELRDKYVREEEEEDSE